MSEPIVDAALIGEFVHYDPNRTDLEYASLSVLDAATPNLPARTEELRSSESFTEDADGNVVWQLNETNLDSFKNTVQKGGVPLRTDCLNSYSFPGPTGARRVKYEVNSNREVSPVREDEMEVNEASQYVHANGSRNNSLAKVDEVSFRQSEVGSSPLDVEPTRRRREYELSDTQPSHFPGILSKGARNASPPDEKTALNGGNLHVDPAFSKGSPIEASSRSAFIQETDLYSTQSVGERSFSDLMSETNLRSLSKESLLQLKQELQSDSIPLRSELLAGLETVMRAIVLPPFGSEERSQGGCSSKHVTQHTWENERSELIGEKFPDTDFGAGFTHSIEPSGACALSFHSTLVEPAATENLEPKESVCSSNDDEEDDPMEGESVEPTPREVDKLREDSYSQSVVSTAHAEKSGVTRLAKNQSEDDGFYQLDKFEDSLQRIENSLSRLIDSQKMIQKTLNSHLKPSDSRKKQGLESAFGGPIRITLVVNTSEGKKLEYFFPFALTASVGECKAIVLDRLKKLTVFPPELTGKALDLTYLGKHLFDDDTCGTLGLKSGDVLEMALAS